MRSVALLVGFTLALAVSGCAKKPKPTEKSDDSASASRSLTPAEKMRLIEKDRGPQGIPAPAKTEKPAEKKNWVGDPRYKPKSEGDELPPEAPPNGGKPPWVGQLPPGAADAKLPAQPQPGGVAPPNPNPVGAGKQPEPMGKLQPQPVPKTETPAQPAAASKVTKQDMENIFTFVDALSLSSGQMPEAKLIYAALLKEAPGTAALVKDGSIVLTGATVRESVWAFEKVAATQGGMIVTQNKVETVTAAELARRITGR